MFRIALSLLLLISATPASSTELGPGLTAYGDFQRRVQADCGKIVSDNTAIEMTWLVSIDGTATEIEIRSDITPELKTCVLDTLAQTPFEAAERPYLQTFVCTIQTHANTRAEEEEEAIPSESGFAEDSAADEPERKRSSGMGSAIAGEMPINEGAPLPSFKPETSDAPIPLQSLSRGDIMRTVRASQSRLESSCSHLVKERTFIKVNMTISAAGHTESAELPEEHIDSPIGACLQQHVLKLRFPEAGKTSAIRFPFRVQPKDQ